MGPGSRQDLQKMVTSKRISEVKKQRRPAHLPGQRAPIACIPCRSVCLHEHVLVWASVDNNDEHRQRKIRCSSGWPSCKSCQKRSSQCKYAGLSQDGPVEDSAIRLSQESPSEKRSSENLPEMPKTELIQIAEFFLDNFGTTLLFFVDPVTFRADFGDGKLDKGFVYATIALVFRVSPNYSRDRACEFYDYAGEMTQRSRDIVSLPLIQTYLVLCVYEVGCGYESKAWMHLGSAIRMAQMLRLSVMDKPPNPFDWGRREQTENEDRLASELQRRTFWSCYFLDRLLSNGRDRPSGIDDRDVFCHLPISEEDLIFRRFHPSSSAALSDFKPRPDDAENIYIHLARIISILGAITTWHGRGGRHLEKAMPWKSDMPFTVLDTKLNEWADQIPAHLRYSLDTFNAISIVSRSRSRIWGLSHLFFFLAKAHLHREYYPFTPQKGYSPWESPFDPSSTPDDWESPPPGWREHSIRELLGHSGNMIDLYEWMMARYPPFPGVYPFMGLCLMTSASVNLVFACVDAPRFEQYASRRRIKSNLNRAIKAMEALKPSWNLPAYWVCSLRRSLETGIQHLTRP